MSGNVFADNLQQNLNIGVNNYAERLLENEMSKKLKLIKKEKKGCCAKKTQRKLDPISQDDREECAQKITDLHPLSWEPWASVFPTFGILCCCLSNKPKAYTDKQKAEIRNEIDEQDKGLDLIIERCGGEPYQGNSFAKAKKEENGVEEHELHQESQDPLNDYGFGIVAYFNILFTVFCVMFCVTFFAAALMQIYYDARGLEEFVQPGFKNMFTKFTMGNLGFSETECHSFFKGMDPSIETVFNCGMDDAQLNLKYFGIIAEPSSNDKQGLEKQTFKDDEEQVVGNSFCGDISLLKDEDNCLTTEVNDSFKKKFQDDCFGKNNCTMKLGKLLDQKLKCPKPKKVYVQIQCKLEGDSYRFNEGIIIVLLGLVISSVFMAAMYKMQNLQDDQYENWDNETCTPADYTMLVRLTNSQIKKFDEDTRGISLNKYLKDTIEEHVVALDQALPGGYQQHLQDKIKVNVAMIKIAYRNGFLIRRLKKRGTMLATGNFDGLTEIEDDLNYFIEHNKDYIKQPIYAFVTFTNQEGKERFGKHNSKYLPSGANNPDYKPFKLLGEDAEVKICNEPSDIIWENLEFSKLQRASRTCLVTIAITLFLIVTFIVFAFLRSQAGLFADKYPSSTSCPKIKYAFTKNQVLNETLFTKVALQDKNAVELDRGAGIYQCYCQDTNLFKQNITQKEQWKKDCQDYQELKWTSLALSNLVTVLVSVVNILVRNITFSLIDFIGYATESEKVAKIMQVIFITSFVNTAILSLFTNANFEYTPVLQYLLFFIRRQYTDFGKQWYIDQAPVLFQTMVISAFMPYVEVIISMITKQIFRILDRGSTGSVDPAKKSKKTTKQAFIDLYSGPVYMIHFKYSTIIMQIYIAFAYGLFVPFLFITSTIGVINMYIVERICMYYFYQYPPSYDDKLSRKALTLLNKAPIVMFAFGYWAIGNRQIFFNESQEMIFTNKEGDPNHNFFTAKGYHMWLCLAIFVMLVLFHTARKFMSILQSICPCFCKTESNDVDMLNDEYLPNFWDALRGDEQKIWYTQEIYNRKVLGIQSIDDDALQKLRTGKRGQKYDDDVALDEKKMCKRGDKYFATSLRYDILSEQNYQKLFQYETINEKEEEEMQAQAHYGELWYDAYDKVVLSLNLDQRLERPKNVPQEHPQFMFFTSEEKFFGEEEKEKTTVQ